MRTHIKETPKSMLLALCEGNSPVTGEFPAQVASNAEKPSIGWCHHEYIVIICKYLIRQNVKCGCIFFCPLSLILWCAVCEHLGPFYKHGLTLIPAWISNHILSKKWEWITNSFSNFNGCNSKGWEWISNFIIHFILGVIIYSCRDYRWFVLVKGSQKWSNWLRSKQNGRYFADDILKFKLLNSKI